MKFVALLVGLAAAQYCFPATCSKQLDCYDSIHGYYGYCCSGKCTDLYSAATKNPVFVGGSCTTSLSSLGGSSSCAFCDWIATCSQTTGKCVAKMPNGCACTLSTQSNCISTYCSTSNTGAYVCLSYTDLPVGATCYADSECDTGVCGANNKCTGVPQGGACSTFEQNCAAGLTCRYNSTVFAYVCSPLCTVGVASCCSTTEDCAAGTYCYTYNDTCIPTLAAGADCTYAYSGACGTGAVCNCFNASCYNSVCVPVNSVADGQPCSAYSTAACHVNSYCAQINLTAYNSYVCVGNASIASGAPCAVDLSYGVLSGTQCIAPANACGDIGNTGQATCHVGGTAAVGAGCDPTFATGDCANGLYCARNSSYPYNYYCAAKLANNANCSTATYDLPCAAGSDRCYKLGSPTSSCYYLSYGCTCNAPAADGAGCVTDKDCKATSKCGSGICTAVDGATCATESDCPSGAYWDCNCSKKCHYTVVSPTPIVYTDPCQTQENAAAAVYPNFQSYSESGTYLYGSVYNTQWANYVGPWLGRINDTNVVAKLLQYICCGTCVAGNPRFEAPPGGWQADCATYKLTAVPSSCNPTTGAVALLNCFKSGASTLAMSVAAMGAIVFAVLF